MKIAERAIKSKGWRWMPGMLARYSNQKLGHRLTEADNYGIPSKCRPPDPKRALPDLTDPATLGCLLALVRDAHRDAYMAAGCDGEDWIVADCDGFEVSRGRSEREVLIKALEAAPEYKELEL